MKISEISLSNFKGSKEKVVISFPTKELIVYILGGIGEGKSNILKALLVTLSKSKKSQFNSKYRSEMITDGASKFETGTKLISNETYKDLDGNIVNHEIDIYYSLTKKDSENIKISSTLDGIETLEDVLEYVNFNAIDPYASIVTKSPKEQAKVIGIDTTKHDENIKKEKKRIQPFNAEKNRLDLIVKSYEFEPKKVDRVDLKKLYAEKEEIRIFNDAQDKIILSKTNKEFELKKYVDNRAILEEQIRLAQEKLIKYDNAIASKQNEILNLDKPKDKKPFDEINKKIEDSDMINAKADKYDKFIEAKESLEVARETLLKESESVKKAEKARIDYIQSRKIPEWISFDDDGGLLIKAFRHKNPVPLNDDFYSDGQMLTIAIKMACSQILTARKENPDYLSVVVIDDILKLGTDGHEFIADIADKYDIQFIIMETGTTRRSKTDINITGKILKR